MIELLRRVAAYRPDDRAVVTDDAIWSYGELEALADAYAAGLRRRGIDRFAIVSNDVPQVVALLAASSLVGVEACVYDPVASATEVAEQAATFSHEHLVTDRDDLHPGDEGPVRHRPADLHSRNSPVDAPASPRPLLVLTTGTTGTPRGVRHDWDRQLARSDRARDGAGQVWLLCYGPQQFAGLQVLIHVLSTGATLVAPPVRTPRAVLPAIHEHGVDHISATPTFWRFLLAELRAGTRPLPALRQVTLGGEAAPASLLDDLAGTFGSARISHVYAGSEFGSTGSVRDGQGGLPAALLDREGDEDVQLRIVDGELWVRSRAGMLGYHGESDVPDGEWVPTGDLVEVVGERIVFRGRASDVINVGGVKVHPLPVEERVTAVSGVRLARVYGRENPLVGAVVAVDVLPDGTVGEEELTAAVRAACADLPRSWQPRSVRVVEELTMRQGKVVRGTTPPE